MPARFDARRQEGPSNKVAKTAFENKYLLYVGPFGPAGFRLTVSSNVDLSIRSTSVGIVLKYLQIFLMNVVPARFSSRQVRFSILSFQTVPLWPEAKMQAWRIQ